MTVTITDDKPQFNVEEGPTVKVSIHVAVHPI
eukprot:CAMPEP_0170834306 /NCGR_PEP_ID=MMETSP0734-20130129/881_1 /TAXON_ID=186038 /ORGANISM="Fragilariopsis kerguelensis, Strain L26-C5" /LENGTH=31 /DNA_ID= /DNA_START= /DNA_END= /DNA_ORIENTATION=